PPYPREPRDLRRVAYQMASGVAFLSALHETVKEKGDAAFGVWYDEAGKEEGSLTFRSLWGAAGQIAHRLHHELGVKKGERVVLCYAPGRHFFAAFLGCLRAGVVAVLVYPPNPTSLEKDLATLNKVVHDCQPVLLLVDSQVSKLRKLGKLNVFSRTRSMWPDISFYRTDDSAMLCGQKCFDEPLLTGTDLAFLQYTSGSTGDPKGVMVTFDNLHHNCFMCRSYWEDGDTGVNGFSWLPQYHDLGLIYMTIAPFHAGRHMRYMSPITFIRKPLLWLQLMAEHGCQWTAAPDFAYRLVTRRFKECTVTPSFDLSCVAQFKSMAEPIRISTLQSFEDTFRPLGLRPDWFYGCYGLAESVVGVSWYGGRQVSSKNPMLQCVGATSTFHHTIDVRIVDPETGQEVLGDDTGEVLVFSPSNAAGYFGKLELSEETFRAKINTANPSLAERFYLRTGDLGFMENGKLFICGRMKDVIIFGGRNIYPQDIEFAVQDTSSAVRPGCIAAFSRSETAPDELEVVFEIRKAHEPAAPTLVQEVHASILGTCGISASSVTAVKEKTIPKTTSGKIRRRATRTALHDGQLHTICCETFDMTQHEQAQAPEAESVPTTTVVANNS
ncbi:unnamed protein product, partial [Chrysoparadoxa australica]